MTIKIKQSYRFKKIKGKPFKGFIMHNNECIFSPSEALRIRPESVEKIETKYIYYDATQKDFDNALKEMPDYQCWDSTRRVLVKGYVCKQ